MCRVLHGAGTLVFLCPCSSCFFKFSLSSRPWEWPLCAKHVPSHIHIPVCGGSGFAEPVSRSPDVSWQEFNSSVAGGKKIRATMCCKHVTHLPPFWHLTKVWNRAVSPRPCEHEKERAGLCLHCTNSALKTYLQPTVSGRHKCLLVVFSSSNSTEDALNLSVTVGVSVARTVKLKCKYESQKKRTRNIRKTFLFT